MKNKILLLIVLFIIFIAGCNKNVKVTHSKENRTSDENLEYTYAFTEATKQFVFGNIKQALVLYQKCIEVNPKSAASYYQMSLIFTNVGEIDRAITYAKKSVELNKEQIWYKLNLANLYKSGGKSDSAQMIFENLVEENDENLDYQFTLANLFAENKEFKSALDVLEGIEKAYGITEQVSIAKHQIYGETGNYRKAEEEIRELIEYDPDNIMYHGMLAEFYSEIGENEKAEQEYKKILEFDDSNAFVYFSTAEHYVKKGELDKAFEFYRKGLNNESLSTDEKLKTIIGIITNANLMKERSSEVLDIINQLVEENKDNVRVLTLRADFFVRTNQLEKGEKDLEKVIEKEKRNFVIWEQILYIKNALQKFESLLSYANEAKKLFPDQPTVYMFKGLAEMSLDRNGEAVQSFNTGLKKSGENRELKIQFLTFLGDVYRDLGKNEYSDEAFEKVLRMDPTNMIVLNNYSYYLSIRKERLDKAEEYSRMTIEREPDNPTYLDTYAWILYNKGDYEKALKYIKRAYEKGGSKNPEILEHYGDILLALGKVEDALLYWKAASILDADNKGLINKIRSNE